MVVERQLNAQGKQRTDLGREEFVAARLGVEGAVRRHDHARRCAASAIRSTGRATASRWTRACRSAVAEVFVRLYDEGLIYRGKRLVNWDPVLLTALSDLEVQSEEEDGQLWHLRYPLADGSRPPRRRDDAPRDDARRHRGRRESGGRALPTARSASSIGCR